MSIVENVEVDVLNSPMLFALDGTKYMLPFGASTPPMYLATPEIPVEISINTKFAVTGLNRPIPEASYGTKYIKPSFAKTPPLYFCVPEIGIDMGVKAFVDGLNSPMLPASHGAKYKFPFGSHPSIILFESSGAYITAPESPLQWIELPNTVGIVRHEIYFAI